MTRCSTGLDGARADAGAEDRKEADGSEEEVAAWYGRAMRSARSLVAAAALTQLACTAHEQPAPEQAAPAQEKAPEPEPEKAPEPEPAPPPVETPPEPEPQPPPPPPPEHATVIEPEPGVTEWTELPGLSAITGFHPFVIGVLAECDAGQWCKLYDDGRLEPTTVNLGYERVWGIWRSDAWRVDIDTREFETDDDRASIGMTEVVTFERWRGDSFQKQGRFEGEVDLNGYLDDEGRRNEPTTMFRKGWAGGMLVYDGGFKRLPESGPPVAVVFKPANMREFFETESGALMFATGGSSGELIMHSPCASVSCNHQPFNPKITAKSYWDFPLDVSRGGDSMTIVVVKDEEQVYLLHYDSDEPGQPGRWSFELLPGDEDVPDAIWPDTRGGVWIAVGDGLWYRNKAGRWFDVALPGKAIDFANRLKPREFLALVEGEQGNRVFATRGPVKAAPAGTAAPAVEPAASPEPAAAPEPAVAPTPATTPEP